MRKTNIFTGGITPVVKVCSYPKGFPMAKQLCPTRKPREVPIRAGLNLSASTSTCRTKSDFKECNMEPNLHHRNCTTPAKKKCSSKPSEQQDHMLDHIL
jgi:hypothetical protein